MNASIRRNIAEASLLLTACIAYAWWINFSPYSLIPRPAVGIGLTFNSMLEHLLHGQFDVDASVVGEEGFLRDGRVFAYWGIFPALLRFPLLMIPGGASLDMTSLSCLMAVALAALVKLGTLHLIFRSTSDGVGNKLLFWALALTLLFSGAQIQFLRPSIYQEVCLWSGACGSVFVYCAVRGLLVGGFSTVLLATMASVAGLALLTRVSTGIGLYSAIGLLLLVMLIPRWREHGGSNVDGVPSASFLATLGTAQFLVPGLILIVFAVLTGLVNYERWGSPLVFADYRLYLMNSGFPDRMLRTEEYGLFNIERIPFGILYYFFPIWVIVRGDGRLLFEEHQTRLLDNTEIPPGSFLLTDMLLTGLLVYAMWSLFAGRNRFVLVRVQAIAIGVGLAASGLLMLCAISMNYRYRIDFYPFIELSAFLGLNYLKNNHVVRSRTAQCAVVAAAAVSICASHLMLIIYKISDYGPSIERIRGGLFQYYSHRLPELFPSLAPYL